MGRGTCGRLFCAFVCILSLGILVLLQCVVLLRSRRLNQSTKQMTSGRVGCFWCQSSSRLSPGAAQPQIKPDIWANPGDVCVICNSHLLIQLYTGKLNNWAAEGSRNPFLWNSWAVVRQASVNTLGTHHQTAMVLLPAVTADVHVSIRSETHNTNQEIQVQWNKKRKSWEWKVHIAILNLFESADRLVVLLYVLFDDITAS